MNYLRFLDESMDPALALDGTYNPFLVALSILVAVVAAYSALGMATRVRSTRSPRRRLFWLLGGALVMGSGIWSMHFIGMEAFSLPAGIRYDIPLTLFSMFPALVASLVSIMVLSQAELGRRDLILGGILLGAGIGTMHYFGMAAMRVDALMVYDPGRFALSLVVAVVLATIALQVEFSSMENLGHWKAFLSAAIMGLAVATMHYMGMAAAYFFPGAGPPTPGGISPGPLGWIVGSVALVIMGVGIASVTADRRFQALATGLRWSQAQYRELFDRAADLIMTSDLDGNITSVNKAGADRLGYSVQEILDFSISDLIAPEDRSIREKHLEQMMLEGKTSVVYCLHLVAREGRRIPLEVNISQIFKDGKPVAVQGIGRDLSERIQMEERLRKAEKMEAVAEIANGMAHEVNNALTVIIGSARSAAARITTEPGWRKNLERIEKAADRIALLTRQLRAFGQTDIFETRVFDLKTLIRDLEPVLRQRLGSGIEIETRLPAQALHLRTDRAQLEGAILAMGENAREAMPDGGRLRIDVTPIELDTSGSADSGGLPPGSYVSLTVRDDGKGMDAEVQKRIFDPFFTTKNRSGSAGMNLAAIHGFLHQCGGDVSVSSEIGHGATFTMRLPRIEGELVAPTPFATPERTILVVEHQEMLRDLILETLEPEGYTVLGADSTARALKIAEQHPGIDVLLTEVVMPGMDGPSLAEAARQAQPGLRMLYMSGYDPAAIAEQGIRLAPDSAFLPKPFGPDELLSAVRESLSAVV